MKNFYRIKNIDNCPNNTCFSIGVYDNCRLYEIIEECFNEDEPTSWVMFNDEITPDECIALGATKFETGDGWDDPIEYHLRGNKKEIAELYLEKIKGTSVISDDFENFLIIQILENLPHMEGA